MSYEEAAVRLALDLRRRGQHEAAFRVLLKAFEHVVVAGVGEQQ